MRERNHIATTLMCAALCHPAHASTPQPFDGLWAAHFELATATKVPILGELTSRTHQWALLDARAVDGQIQVRQTVCSVQILNPAMTSEVPQAWVRSIPPRTWRAAVVPGDTGLTLHADLGVAVTGYDPRLGPLPERGTDASIIDQDNDGHPGVTLRVKPLFGSWGEVYIASRTQWTLRGSMRRDRVSGDMQVTDARQAVLGASSQLLMRKTDSRPVSEESHFDMRRLPEGATCREVLRMAQRD